MAAWRLLAALVWSCDCVPTIDVLQLCRCRSQWNGCMMFAICCHVVLQMCVARFACSPLSGADRLVKSAASGFLCTADDALLVLWSFAARLLPKSYWTRCIRVAMVVCQQILLNFGAKASLCGKASLCRNDVKSFSVRTNLGVDRAMRVNASLCKSCAVCKSLLSVKSLLCAKASV